MDVRIPDSGTRETKDRRRTNKLNFLKFRKILILKTVRKRAIYYQKYE